MLRRAGFIAPPERWQRVVDLLASLTAAGRLPADPAALRPMLAPLFCMSPEEQRRFTALFAEWLACAGLAEPAPAAPALAPTLPPPRWREWLWPLLIVVLIGLWMPWPGPLAPPLEPPAPPEIGQPAQPGEPRTPAPAAPTTPAPGPGSGGAEPPPSELLPRVVTPPWEPPPDLHYTPKLVAPWPAWQAWLGRALYWLPLLSVLAWLLLGWWRWGAVLRAGRGAASLALDLSAVTPPPAPEDLELGRDLRRLHQGSAHPSRRLALRATVEATARRAGLFLPVYRQRWQTAALVVLHESRPREDQLAGLARLLVNQLRAMGVRIHAYTWPREPTRVLDREGRVHTLAELARRHAGARLLIIGEPAGLIGADGRPLPRLTAALADWPRRGLLDTRLPPRAWAESLAAIGLPLAELDARGLRWLVPALLDAPCTQRPTREPTWTPLPPLLRDPVRWTRLTPPPTAERRALGAVLAQHLAPDGAALLLAAMAAYPSLHRDLTLLLDASLYPDDPPERRERRLLRVARLPWCRAGWLPDWLREDLLVACPRTNRQRIRGLYRRLLLGLAGARAGTAPHALPVRLRSEPDWSGGPRAWTRRLAARLRALADLRALRALSPPRGPLHEPILARLLFHPITRRLDLRLPGALVRGLPGARWRALAGRLPAALVLVLVALGLGHWLREAGTPVFDAWALREQQAANAAWRVRIAYVDEAAGLAQKLADALRRDGFQPSFDPLPLFAIGNINTVELGDPAALSAAGLIAQRLQALSWDLPTQLADRSADLGFRERPPADQLRVLVRSTGMQPVTLPPDPSKPPIVRGDPFAGSVPAVPGNPSRAPIDAACTTGPGALMPDKKGRIDRTLAVRSLREGAPVFFAPVGNTVRGGTRFGAVFETMWIDPDEPEQGRVLVRRPADREPLGWMDRADLLCRATPLRTAPTGGIERKAFIRTATTTPGQTQSVTAFPGPVVTDCPAGGGCRALSRFELLFVYAEDPQTGRLLLGFEHSLLDVDVKPVGWVPAAQTIPWHTRYGLRPADHVAQTQLYASADAASRRDKSQAFPVIGNQDGRWYGYPMHLPLVAKEEVGGQWVYKVAAPGPKLNVGADPFAGTDDNMILTLKGVDVLFLIDGTRSMGPYIAEVASAVETSPGPAVDDNSSHSGNHFRFGYRIYRDRFADAPPWNCTNGVCEGVALDQADCTFDPATTTSSRDKVVAGLGAVRVSEEQADGYPEALFAGVGQAIDDLGGCDDRLKVLIVIGDHGDHGALPGALHSKIANSARDFLVFFVQTPPTTTAADYLAAYAKFQADADAVLRLLYGRSSFLDHPLEAERTRALLHLDNAAATGQLIRDLIAGYTSSRAVNEVFDAIRGGEGLDAFLRERMQQGDLPVLFWERVYTNLCAAQGSRLGPQCTQPVEHTVDHAWAPANHEWTPEVWLDARDLDAWLNTLDRLSRPGGGSAENLRQAFINLLLDVLQKQVGQPPIPDTGETFEQFVQRRAALPVREQSPLLGYDLATLRQIEPCELRRLQIWAGQVHDLLERVKANPTLTPELNLQDYPDNCAGLSDSGRRIPNMALDAPNTWGPLTPDGTGSYEHDLHGVRYWLPQAFLP
jgi:hypothetical protein